jgi:hypothetical protein
MSPQSQRREIEGLSRTIRPKWPMPIKFGTAEDTDETEAFFGEGEWCYITITDARETQARDYDTGEMLTWPSGDPLMVLVVLGTTERDGVDCSLFIQGRELTKAFGDARLAVGAEGIAPGDRLGVVWSGTKPTEPKPGRSSRAKLSPTKTYEATLELVS